MGHVTKFTLSFLVPLVIAPVPLLSGRPLCTISDSLEQQAKLLVTAESESFFALHTGRSSSSFDSSNVVIHGVDIGTKHVCVWRARLGNSIYLIGGDGHRLFRLGGFAAPEIMEISALLAGVEDNPYRFGLLLAALADPSGAVAMGVSGHSLPVKLPPYYSRRIPNVDIPTSWPKDTVAARDIGRTTVLVTVLSQQSMSYDQRWRAIAYAFVLDSSGRLVGWTRRLGGT